MKLRDVPDPVWYGLLAIVAAGGVYWLSKRAADAVKGAGQTIYRAGNGVQEAIVPGEDSLGTWLAGRWQDESGNTKPSAVVSDWLFWPVKAVGAFGELLNDAIVPGEDSLGTWLAGSSSGAPAGSWSANGYDYGTAGVSGIPWRYEAKPLPDIFNFSLDYLK